MFTNGRRAAAGSSDRAVYCLVAHLFLLGPRDQVWHVSALRGFGVNSAPIPSVLNASYMQLLPDDLPFHRQEVLARTAPWYTVVGCFHGVRVPRRLPPFSLHCY